MVAFFYDIFVSYNVNKYVPKEKGDSMVQEHAAISSQQSVFEVLWSQLKAGDFKGIGHTIQMASIDWVQLGLWLGLGVFVGFLSKKYLQQVLMLLVIGTIIVCVLDHYSLITIQWESIKALLNIKAVQEQGVQSLFNHVIAWLKINASIVTTASIGFIIGWLVG